MLPAEQAVCDAMQAAGYDGEQEASAIDAFGQAFGMLGPGLEIRHTTLMTFAAIVAQGCVDTARMDAIATGIPLARKLLQVELGLALPDFTDALKAGAPLTHEQVMSWVTMINDAHRPARLNS